MLRGAGRTEAVARVRVSDKQLEPYTGFYTVCLYVQFSFFVAEHLRQDALQKLKEVYAREKTG